MHIGTIHFYNRSFPPEIRLEKESWALIRAGHKVTVLTQKTNSDQIECEEYGDRFFINRASIKPLNRFQDILSRFSLFFNNYIPHLKKFIENEHPDVLHVHDLGPIPTVLKVAREYSLPVIADLHENMPAALVAWRHNDQRLKKAIRSISLNYYIWRWHEAQVLKKCYKTLVVVPEAAERLYDYGISEEKILVVSNTEDETTFKISPEKADPEICNRYKNNWVVSYIGGLGPHRGVDNTLCSLPFIGNKIPNLKLLIVGATDNQTERIRTESKSYGMENKVDVIGWQPFDKIHSYVMTSQVCLVPHNDFEHTQTTVPHKLFQYMICSKPVLVSNCRPLKRIVEDTHSGVIFKANDPVDMAEKLVYMYQNPDKIAEMGQNGKRAALGKYAWRNDARKLIDMYAKLENKLKLEK